MDEFLVRFGTGEAGWRELGISLLLVAAALALGWLIARIVFWILTRFSRKTPFGWDDIAIRHARRPIGFLFPLLALNAVIPALKLPPGGQRLFAHLSSLLLILAIAWALVGAVRFFRDLVLLPYKLDDVDNLVARKMHTQVKVLEKVALTVIAVITTAFILTTIPGVRQVGVSLLASAGIAGIVIGLAAQKSIGTLLAGIQIAITQPARIDDVVIVENEWGRIEEITLTYVVVRIWDLRRLVLPITYFLDKPFQNWTRVSADLLGTVFLYTDYTVPVDAVRAEFERLLKGHPLWDGKVCVTQVTDSKPDTMEIRLLLSTRNSGDGWDLRCEIREKMIAFLRENYPTSLPRTRVELTGPRQGAENASPGPAT